MWKTFKNTQRQKTFLAGLADVNLMIQQLFNVSCENTRGTPHGKKTCLMKTAVAVLEHGSNSCVLTRARTQAGARDSPSESMTSSACRRTQKVLAHISMWESAVKEHVKYTGCEVADINHGKLLETAGSH